jgi:hypothetical protein
VVNGFPLNDPWLGAVYRVVNGFPLNDPWLGQIYELFHVKHCFLFVLAHGWSLHPFRVGSFFILLLN